MRDREQIFSDYVIELRQREKEESRTHREKVHCSVLLDGWAESETDGFFIRTELTFCGFVAVHILRQTCRYCYVFLCSAVLNCVPCLPTAEAAVMGPVCIPECQKTSTIS